MSIRFVKMLISVIWQTRHNSDECLKSILHVFAQNGNITVQYLIEYMSYDENFPNQFYRFEKDQIVKVWRKDIK